MRTLARNNVWVTSLLLAALTTSTLAPVAQADHDKGKHRGGREARDRDGGWDQRSRDWGRDRNDGHNRRVVRYVDRSYAYRPAYRPSYRSPRYSTYIVRRSNAGPVIAGFIGGLFLGATLANTPPRGYDYYDPYCHQRFSTLNAYYRESYAHHHPHEILVVDCDSPWGSRGSLHSGGYVDDGYDQQYDDYQDDGCNH